MRIRRIVTGCIAGLYLFLRAASGSPAVPGGGPVVIDSPDALAAFSEAVSAGQTYAGQTVVLAGDIDMAGRAFGPIGQRPGGDGSGAFRGVFDGQGHAIRRLTVTGGSGEAGLFALLDGAVVKNLRLEVSVGGQGQTAVGGLAGRMVDSSLFNVAVDGNVTAGSWAIPGDGVLAAGVIAGRAEGRTVLDRCAARGSLGAAGSFSAAVYAGGAFGYLQGATVTNCYSTAYLFVNDAGITAGGFAGYLADSALRDSYAASGMVTGANTAGAFAGLTAGSSFYNVWHDGELTAPLPGAGGVFSGVIQGAPTAQMQSAPFPSQLSEAFYQAAPGQNNGYPVLDFEAIVIPTEVPVPTEEPTPVPTDTPAPTEEPTPVPTDEPIPTENPSPVPTDMPIPTEGPSPVPTDTPIPTDEPPPVPTDTPIPTEGPSPVPTDTPIPTDEPSPVPTDEPIPTENPSPVPTDVPIPTENPSPVPTDTPIPTDEPTPIPTDTPIPADKPSPVPTDTPIPTDEPSPGPTDTPIPTEGPSPGPTDAPIPTDEPSPVPIESPVPPVTSEPYIPTADTPAPTGAPAQPAGSWSGPTGPDTSTTAGPTAPRTADDAHALPWLALLLALTAALAAIVRRYRR